MASLVAEVKRTHRLTENTVLKIVDMNFALAQSSGAPTFGGDEEFMPDAPEDADEESIPEGQLVMFPPVGSLTAMRNLDDDEDIIATVKPEEEV